MEGQTTPVWDLPAPAPSEAEAKRLMNGPFGAELHRLTVSHMTYLVFGTQGAAVSDLRSATCFFVRSPAKLFAVTARHVLEEIRNAQLADSRTLCQIGNIIVDPIDRQLGQGSRIDIATFEVTQTEIETLRKVPISLWPPEPPPTDGCGVLLAGFPKAGIEVVDPHHAGFGIYTASAVAQRVTDWQITSRVEWDHVVGLPAFGGLPPKNFDTGGMSGGPMLLVRNRMDVLSFPLVGVIAEGRKEDDTIIAERADFIRANGSIR